MRDWRSLCILIASVLVTQATPVCAQSAASPFTAGARYDEARLLVGAIAPDPDGSGGIKYAAMRNTYDVNGRLVKTELGELGTWQPESIAPSAWTGFTVFRTQDLAYDDAGRKIKETVASASTVYSVKQSSYDNMDRLLCSATRMNAAVFASLPADACVLGTAGTVGYDRITKNVYDDAGRLIQERQGVGTTLEQADKTYSYTLDDKQQYLIDAKGNRAQFTYDGFDRTKRWYLPSKTGPSAFDPTSQTTALATASSASTTDYEEYDYDANDNRTSFRKRDGQTLGYTYDALNRMTLKDIPGGTVADVYYAYDLRGLQLTARFGSVGGLGVTHIFDASGRLSSETSNMGGITRTLSYQYDANDNRIRLTWPDSNYYTFAFDGLDRMISGSQSGATTLIALSYDNQAHRSSFVGGGTTSYSYDPIGRLSSLAHDFSGTAADVTIGLSSYNPASQLLAHSKNNDAYAFTGFLNLTRGYTTNGLNQYTVAGPASFTFDANGNLTGDGTLTYAYDSENRLVSTSSGLQLNWDPLGRLFSTGGTTSGTTQFLYSGDALVAEYDGSNALLRRYVHGPGADEPLIWYEGSAFTSAQSRTLKSDYHGSVIAVSDASGANLAINSYDEYGITKNSANSAVAPYGRFGYTGQAWLPELGMYYYKARIYSPTLGRFLQVDPIGYDDQINLYSYVANDPVNNVDSTGEQNCPQIGCEDPTQNGPGGSKGSGDLQALGREPKSDAPTPTPPEPALKGMATTPGIGHNGPPVAIEGEEIVVTGTRLIMQSSTLGLRVITVLGGTIIGDIFLPDAAGEKRNFIPARDMRPMRESKVDRSDENRRLRDAQAVKNQADRSKGTSGWFGTMYQIFKAITGS